MVGIDMGSGSEIVGIGLDRVCSMLGMSGSLLLPNKLLQTGLMVSGVIWFVVAGLGIRLVKASASVNKKMHVEVVVG